MPEELKLPVSDEELLSRARAALASQGWQVAGRTVPKDVPLRIDERHAFRRVSDGRPVAYSVRILIDPKHGVPCDAPEAEPRWAATSVLYVMLDENGAPLSRQAIR